MANIWPVYEGREPTFEEPWARLPAKEAVRLLKVRRKDYLCGLDSSPRFGPSDRSLWYAGYKHVVLEIESEEGQQSNWKPGFYRSPIRPKEAFRRLVELAVKADLEAENVVRSETEPTTDSQGRDAHRVTVVITPGAAARLDGNTVIDFLLGLRSRLHEAGDDRMPIIEYATEAELLDASP